MTAKRKAPGYNRKLSGDAAKCWGALTWADIRANYRNRPRFMDILDKLDGRTIVETHRARRHR